MRNDPKDLQDHIEILYDCVIALFMVNIATAKNFAHIAENINAELAALLKGNAIALERDLRQLQELRKKLPPS
ncbi:MAG: hypothetical protein ABSA12_02860 [Verrucomicrobiia bacterium]